MDGSKHTSRRVIAALVLGVSTSMVLLLLSTTWHNRGDARIALADDGTTWPTIALSATVSGLNQPLHIAHAGDGSGRLFIVERAGTIRILKNGSLESTPFLSISGRVGSSGGEQGLLSVAFPPDYDSKGWFYVDYTDLNGDTVIARYSISSNPDLADSSSEEIILSIDQPYSNHNGGQLAFGPDGYLYISLGDGGGGGDPLEQAQNPATLLGSILRIDVEPSSGMTYTVPITWTERVYLPIVRSAGNSYRIPSTNPFTQTAGYRNEIWAFGLRNPWRFSFDRSSGDLYIADVGQGAYEEVDFQPASSPGGENYGWDIAEGDHCYEGPCSPYPAGLTFPILEYDHSQGCSVTGGVVYRGPDPDLDGIYFYGDFCSGRIWGLVQEGGSWPSQLLLNSGLGITSFGEDETGNVYVTDYWSGGIYQIVEVP